MENAKPWRTPTADDLSALTADEVRIGLGEHRFERHFYTDEELQRALGMSSHSLLRQLQTWRVVRAGELKRQGRGTMRGWPLPDVFRAALIIELAKAWDISTIAAVNVLGLIPDPAYRAISREFGLGLLLERAVATGQLSSREAAEYRTECDYEIAIEPVRSRLRPDAILSLLDRRWLVLTNARDITGAFNSKPFVLAEVSTLAGPTPVFETVVRSYDDALDEYPGRPEVGQALEEFVAEAAFNMCACIRRFIRNNLSE